MPAPVKMRKVYKYSNEFKVTAVKLSESNRLAHPSFPFSPAGVEVPLVMKKLFQLEAG